MKDHGHIPDDPEAEDAASPRFRAALVRLYKPGITIPPAVNDAVLRSARQHFAPRAAKPALGREAGFWLRTLFQPLVSGRWRWAGAAVAGSFGLWLAWYTLSPTARVETADFNRDGDVDILDALALARKVDAKTVLDRRFDLNRDGTVDRADADAIARRAVALEPGTEAL